MYRRSFRFEVKLELLMSAKYRQIVGQLTICGPTAATTCFNSLYDQ